jgi:hypothetical protein
VTDECVDCGLPCLGNSCPYRNVTRFYCDDCGEETMLYEFEDKELCKDCIFKRLDLKEVNE